jgi:hypothetical protein
VQCAEPVLSDVQAELKDIAGLLSQPAGEAVRRPADRLQEVDALRVQSFDGVHPDIATCYRASRVHFGAHI